MHFHLHRTPQKKQRRGFARAGARAYLLPSRRVTTQYIASASVWYGTTVGVILCANLLSGVLAALALCVALRTVRREV
jgi:hypothetical protein